MLTALSIIGTMIVGVICYKSGYNTGHTDGENSVKSMEYKWKLKNEFMHENCEIEIMFLHMRKMNKAEYERGFQDGQKTVVINLTCKQ